MPRKPKREKQQISIVVNGQPITVIMHPPTGAHKSWRVYWNGLPRARSTGQWRYDDAVAVAENMLRNGGDRIQPKDLVLSDTEFEEIQRRHFGKRKDPAAQVRAQKSLKSCLEAISAFREITGISLVALATPDDCERFQFEALKRAKNWRKLYPKSRKEGVAGIRPNTVVKWLRQLQAAFERANQNGGKKCVRGVVDESKLLLSNPWKQFTWIDGTEPKKRRFNTEELNSLLDFFEGNWPEVTAAALFAKVSLWMWARRLEVASLCWENLRIVQGEHHFNFVGKRGVRKWARVPVVVYEQLLQIRMGSPYVFAAHNDQLRRHYQANGNLAAMRKVGHQYDPVAFADWFHDKLAEWSKTAPNGHATQHAFRKTGLQFAYRGGVAAKQIAKDASITEAVMLDHYVDDTDDELRMKSNQTFARIAASLPFKVAECYGYFPQREGARPEEVLRVAIERKDFQAARSLLEQMEKDAHSGNGSSS